MWAMDGRYKALISGDHQASVAVDAIYDGNVTVAGLPVTQCVVKRSWDGAAVRATVDITVDDQHGDLRPFGPSDPLGTAGQEITVTSTVGLESHVYLSAATIPEGTFRIQKPRPTGSYVPYREKWWIPTGGTVPLQGVDRISNLQRSDILGIVQPLAGATVRSEVQRLATQRRVPVDIYALPEVPVASVGIYPEDCLEAVISLLDTANLVPAMGRDGSLTALSVARKNMPDLIIGPDRIIDSWVYPDDDSIYNVVQTTGEGGSSSAVIRGIAYETNGPYRYDGPFGWVSFSHSSPLYESVSSANTGAQTILGKKMSTRELKAGATLKYDPTIDPLDTHMLWLAPGLDVRALVVSVSYDALHGGEMDIEYSVDRKVVEEWIRP